MLEMLSILCESRFFPTICLPTDCNLTSSVCVVNVAGHIMIYPAVVMMLRLLCGHNPSVGALMLWILRRTYRFHRWKRARRNKLGVQTQF